MKKPLVHIAVLAVLLNGCNPGNGDTNLSESTSNHGDTVQNADTDTLSAHLKPFDADLPTIGLLIYPGVLTTEVTATADVFAKPDKDGNQLFNVVVVAETATPVVSEEGLTFVPDYTFDNCPELTVLFVPSAYDMYSQVRNKRLVDFIRNRDKETEFTVSNCAGAQLIGASGIEDGRKIVTYVGGGKQLQKDYPRLLVQNDSTVTYTEDGKYSSSNGNLASYISALNLLDKMKGPAHKKFVESQLYLDRLREWKD